MQEDYKFKSVDELYNRVLPALNSKVSEFKKQGINYITEKDIWNYLSKYYWRKKKDLEFYELIDSILNIDLKEIGQYLISQKEETLTKQDDSIL